MNDMSLLVIAFICMKQRHDYVFCVIHTCYCYGSFSYVVKLGNVNVYSKLVKTLGSAYTSTS